MTQRPFDARQALLSDHDAPAGAWRTVSLVTAMREFISRDPDGVIPNAVPHCATLTLCAEELTARGLDANSLVRYGLGAQLVASVLGPYIARLLHPSMTFEGPRTLAEARASEWQDLLDSLMRLDDLDPAAVEPTSAGLRAPLEAIIPSVLLWSQNASLASLISLQAPTLDWIRNQELVETEEAILQPYQWMIDRFSITSLTDWTESSLHLEYRWSKGDGVAPCPLEVMTDRRVAPAELDQEIARRTMAPSGSSVPQLTASLASRMQDQACTLLKDRKFEAAATLFEFAVSENPNDPSAQNNLGFCLMPSAPDQAWIHLNEAARLGYEPTIINLFNRVQCLALLGDKHGALALANQEWEVTTADRRMSAILWAHNEDLDALELAERSNPVNALVALAILLAEQTGSPESLTSWRARLAA